MNVGGRFVVVVCVLASTPALAQPAPPPAPAPAPAPHAPAPATETDPKVLAKEHFLKGVDLAVREEWEAALVEFWRSRELYPTFVALKNAALSLRRLRRHEEALTAYEEALAKFGTQIAAAELAQAKDAIAQLEKMVGTIELRVTPAGATVLVDGRERGKSPLAAPVRLDAGLHTVRVFKPGFLLSETEAQVVAGDRRAVEIALRALSESGVVKIAEAQGRALDVVVDGTTVGKTPWEGSLAVGSHVVLLRGGDELGTMPASFEVNTGKVTPLTLTARVLDAELRIQPVPENAVVHLDGVPLGAGTWQGRTSSGEHRVEVAAKGFLAHQRAIRIEPGTRTLAIQLERNLDDPLWRAAFRPHVYTALHGAFAAAPGLGGDPDAAASEQRPPMGVLTGVRGGYQLSRRFGLELGLGFMHLSAKLTRDQTATADGNRMLSSTDYTDRTRLYGPTLVLSASYRLTTSQRAPIALRVSVGAARTTARFSGQGTFSDGTMSVSIAAQERWPSFFLPYAGAGVVVDYDLGRVGGARLALEGSLSAFVLLPPEVLREAPGGGRRFADFPASDSNEMPLGRTYLPREQALGPAVTVAPGLALRLDL